MISTANITRVAFIIIGFSGADVTVRATCVLLYYMYNMYVRIYGDIKYYIVT